MVSAKFTELYNEITTIPVESSQEEKLSLYAWAKIAQNAEMMRKPSMFDFVGKAKYQTWQGYINEGVSPADAETKYIALAEKLIAAHKQSSG